MPAILEAKPPTETLSDSHRMPNGPYVPIRRNKADANWFIADAEHRVFIDEFASAIVFDVQFKHEAPPMRCVVGYESTGEAIGVVREMENPSMPADAIRTAYVVYNSEMRKFHAKGYPAEVFDKADYLILFSDGKAQAGWRR